MELVGLLYFTPLLAFPGPAPPMFLICNNLFMDLK
jgi:hypothetical protein